MSWLWVQVWITNPAKLIWNCFSTKLNYMEISVVEYLPEASRSVLCLRMFGSISGSKPLRWKEKWPPCCTVNLLPSFYFSFFSLAVWERCLGKEEETARFHGAGVSGTEQRRTKVLTPPPWNMNKTCPSFFRESVPFTTLWGANFFLFLLFSALFSCQLVENGLFPGTFSSCSTSIEPFISAVDVRGGLWWEYCPACVSPLKGTEMWNYSSHRNFNLWPLAQKAGETAERQRTKWKERWYWSR